MPESGVHAFDIDGALTKEEGKQQFRELQNKRFVGVGIVTARPEGDMQTFIEENNLQPDFARSGTFKGRILMGVSDNGTYHGSWFRDRVHASLAGWEYEEV